MLVCFGIGIDANSQNEKKLFKNAQKAFYKQDYSLAKKKYNELLKLYPENTTYHLQTGIVYWESETNKDSSLYYFTQALKHTQKDTSPELFFYLGLAQHYCEKYNDALLSINIFEKFVNTKTNEGRELNNELDRLKNYIQYSSSQNKTDKEINIYPLNEGINSTFHDYAPIFIENDSIIIFTTRRKISSKKKAPDGLYYENILLSKKENGIWKIIVNPSEIKKYLFNNYNSKKHNAAITLHLNNKYLYFYKKDKIWVSEFNNNEWQKATKLAKNINSSKFNIPSVCVSPDGNTIYFVANRNKGIGRKDIYFTSKNANGTWDEAVLLGQNINTELDEDAPYLSEDGKSLYFSSKGHNSIGGYDIFKSTHKNNEWQKAENIGLPFNSSADDIYFSINESEHSGYLSSNRKGGMGYMDIYSFNKECIPLKQTLITGIILPNKISKLKSSIEVFDASNKLVNKLIPDKLGKFSFSVTPEKKYIMTISTENETKHIQHIYVPKQCEKYTLYHEIEINNSAINDSTLQESIISKMAYFNLDKLEISAPSNEEISIISETIFAGIPPDTIKTKLYDELINHYKLKMLDTNATDYFFRINKTLQFVKANTKYSKTSKPVFINKFSYNHKDIEQNNKDYLNFIDSILLHIKLNESVTISIESSASKVPTLTFISNQNLAEKRALEAKLLLFETLKSKGISNSMIKISKVESSVNGPEYTKDSQNVEKYKEYQYVRLKIE